MDEMRKKINSILHTSKNKATETGADQFSLSVDESEFSEIVNKLAATDFILSCLFAAETRENHPELFLYYVFEKYGYHEIIILKKQVLQEKTASIFSAFPAACLYEREISDGFGIVFEKSVDNRHLFLHETYPKNFHPLRKSFLNGPIKTKSVVTQEEEYAFKEVHGDGVYQIPVGPVHAGIIEPGHFRFSVIGETIFNLEIRMFWKHRGIEKLAEGKMPKDALVLAQAISGDETVANSWAYCLAVETISGIQVPPRAEHLRFVFAEMERIYALLGDLAGMVVDVAYPVCASPFFILREEMLRWNEKLSGSRFLKNTLAIGGVQNDVPKETLRALLEYLKSFHLQFHRAIQTVLSQPSVIDRFETAGIVKKELVPLLTLTGPLARASGISIDVRKDHPYGIYKKLSPHIKISERGDVLGRFTVKAETIEDSLQLLRQAITDIPLGKVSEEHKIKDGCALALVESSRGQNMCWVSIQRGHIERYKVKTASFCNWQAIQHAVQGNIVPDFPLINKSMNLSYAGTDL